MSPLSFPSHGFIAHRPEPLRSVVDAIWDWDIADAEVACALAIHQAPSTSLLLMASYRAPILLSQNGASLPSKCARLIRDAAVILRPTGPLGMIVVALRPDAAARIVGAPLGDFAHASISLPDLFGQGEASACSEMLVAAENSAQRVGMVATFLLRRLRPPMDTLACRAAAHLRRDPTLRVQALAAELDISPRHLGRTFQAALGMSPKYFARLARIERIIQQRQRGLAWADIAYDCGMADQAHLIREFEALVGERPTDFFAPSGNWAPGVPVSGHFIVRPTRGEVRKLQSLSVSYQEDGASEETPSGARARAGF
jgi:AraC-like DNA-binding protein